MGNSQTSTFHQSLTDFTIIEKQADRNLTKLKKKQNSKEYLLKQTIYHDEKIYYDVLKQYDARKAYKCQHLTLLERHQTTQTDNMCSTMYKIYGLWVHPTRSLRQEIHERILQDRTFSEKQLWSIAASCILALSQLQKNDIFHEHLSTTEIYLAEDGTVQIADPLTIDALSNFNLIKEKKNNHQNLYLSPEQCSAIESHAFCFRHFKNDVWCLGMILLQCALLEAQANCYRSQYQKVNWLQLDKSTIKLQNKYGSELKSIVKLMLNKNKKDRPDWEELETFVRRDEPKMPSPVKQSFLKTSNLGYKEQRLSDNQTIPIHLANQSHYSPYMPKITLNNIPAAVPAQSQVVSTNYQPTFSANQHSYNKTADIPAYSSINSNFQYSSSSYIPALKPAYQSVYTKPTIPTKPELTFFKPSLSSQNFEFKSPTADMDFKAELSYKPEFISELCSYSKPEYLKVSGPEVQKTIVTPTLITNDLTSSAGFYCMPEREYTEPRDKAHEFGDRETLKTFVSPSSAQGYLFTQRNQTEQKKEEEKEGQLLPLEQKKQFLVGTLKEPQQQKSENQNVNFVEEVKNTESITYQIQHRPFSVHEIENMKHQGLKNEEKQEKNQKRINISNIQPLENNQNNQNIPQNIYEEKSVEKVGKSFVLPPPKILDEFEDEGQMVIEHFKQGSRYEGFKKNGKRHGQGKFFYQDGGMYEGNWNQNKMEGYGALYYQSGRIAYQGQWKDDQFHGKGKLYNQDPQPLEGLFDYCNFDDVDDYWILYEGQFYEDMKQGRGKFTLANGEHYLGEFSTDCINGSGKFFRKNGSIIRGTWKQNHLIASHQQ